MPRQKWSFKKNDSSVADSGDSVCEIQFTNGKEILQTNSDEIEEDQLKQFCELLDLMPDLWSHGLDTALFENSQLKKQNEMLVDALQNIADPISHIKKNLKEGEKLDGRAANELSNSASYLKEIAKETIIKWALLEPEQY